MKQWKIAFIVFLLFACGPKFIYNPVPEKDIKEWVCNFKRQKSFSYTYELKTKAVKVSASGDCFYGWAEYVKGTMDYGNTIINFEHIGINDREWTKKDNKWEEAVRGEESNILAQIERVLEFEKFEFLNNNNNTEYVYRFNATMPFLSPDRWREMVAWIKISRKNYLPAFIWVGLPDSSVYWQVSLTNYNKDIKIEPPYLEINHYEIKIDSGIDQAEVIKKIRRRLKSLKLKWQVKKEHEKIILRAPRIYNVDDIKELLVPGKTVFYGVTHKQNETVKISHLQKNPNHIIYLSDWQCSQELVRDAVIKFDYLLRPFANIKLKNKIELPNQIAVEVDGNMMLLISLDSKKKMDNIVAYSDMKFLDFWKFCAYINEPLYNMDIILLPKGSD